MGNVLNEFLPGRTITPYVGAGVGVDFVDGIRKLISRILIGSGHRVHEASSCGEACRAATRLGPNLLVLSLDTTVIA